MSDCMIFQRQNIFIFEIIRQYVIYLISEANISPNSLIATFSDFCQLRRANEIFFFAKMLKNDDIALAGIGGLSNQFSL